ncbi:MAG: penicillin-binding protein [Acidobacteriota bacterium]
MKALTDDRQLRSAFLGRLLVVLCLFVAWALVVFLRLVDLQTFRGEHYRAQSDTQQQGFIVLAPQRGEILDRNLKELAISVRADSVYAQPPKIQDQMAVARRLSPLLDIPADALFEQLTSPKNFVYLKRGVSLDISRSVRDLEIEGVGTHEDTTRAYPGKELACHVLGIVGVDHEGLEGIEYLFGKELSGSKTRVDLRVDAKRNSFYRDSPETSARGDNLVLTLDSTIQHVAQTALSATVRETGALNGSAIVMDPRTGEILAMASYPEFDPNDYQDFTASQRRNRCILDLYEPGSTFKVITLSALLNEHLVDPNEMIDCSSGRARLGRKVYREAHAAYGLLSVTQVIEKSSNIGTVQLALRLGEARLHDYAARFGFGEPTGIDLPGEESGILRDTSQWSKVSIGAIAIGQEIAVTPLQLIRAIAAVANGGYLVKPEIVKRVSNPAGDTLFEAKPERKRILDASAMQTARHILSLVVEEGTGTKAQLRGYSSCGKTGTAQKFIDGHYSTSRYVASFIGFAPAENPALITLVVVNEPRGGHYYGGYVAAPAYKQIMERALIHLGVPQDRPTEVEGGREMARADAPSPTPLTSSEEDWESLAAGAPVDSASSGLAAERVEVSGDEQIVVESGGEILPNFRGLSLRTVARLCARLGVKLKISGSGVAVAQRPEAGGTVSKGMVCEVFFANEDENGNASAKTALRSSRRSDPASGLRD